MTKRIVKSIEYMITPEIQENLCAYYNKNIESLEDWEICELLDRFLDILYR